MGMQDKALVLKTYPYQERNLIVHAVTENHGKVRLSALNALHSKRFSEGLQLFHAGNWEWTQKSDSELGRLDSIQGLRFFSKIQNQFELLTIGSYINEVYLKMDYGESSSQELFKLYSNMIWLLDNDPDWVLSHRATYLNGFWSKLLHLHGTAPLWATCLTCGNKLDELTETSMLTISVDPPGYSCCLEGSHVSALELAHLAILQASPIRTWGQTLDFHSTDHTIIKRWVQYHIPGLDNPLESERFLL